MNSNDYSETNIRERRTTTTTQKRSHLKNDQFEEKRDNDESEEFVEKLPPAVEKKPIIVIVPPKMGGRKQNNSKQDTSAVRPDEAQTNGTTKDGEAKGEQLVDKNADRKEALGTHMKMAIQNKATNADIKTQPSRGEDDKIKSPILKEAADENYELNMPKDTLTPNETTDTSPKEMKTPILNEDRTSNLEDILKIEQTNKAEMVKSKIINEDRKNSGKRQDQLHESVDLKMKKGINERITDHKNQMNEGKTQTKENNTERELKNPKTKSQM
uniref:Uncharacterized protein n=1 Tax=Cacopsylla melanoneura TaxID=428564 RepID=A0A8D8SAS6_9HEMI